MNMFVDAALQQKNSENDFEKILDSAMKEKDDKKLKEACKQFEAYFIKQMFKEMRKTIPENDFLEKSHGRNIFEDMLDEEYANEASEGRGIGLSQALYKQLSKDIIKK